MPQCISIYLQPLQGNDARGVIDCSGKHSIKHLGRGKAAHANIFALFGQAVDAVEIFGQFAQCAKQLQAFIRATGAAVVARDGLQTISRDMQSRFFCYFAHRYILGADVMRGDETDALELITDLILNPTLPQTSLPDVKKRQIANILEEQEDPLTVAMRCARAEIFAGEPFARTALGTESFRVRTINGTATAGSDYVAVDVYRRVNGAPAAVNPQAAIDVQTAIITRARQLMSSAENY